MILTVFVFTGGFSTPPSNNICNLLFFDREENKLKRQYLIKVFDKYPKLRTIISLMNEFKYILNNKKGIDYLNSWIKKAKRFNGTYINTFIDSIEKDKEAVNNAVIYPYSNGIAEAKVNVTKLNKRIMFGRSCFDLIINRTLYKYY